MKSNVFPNDAQGKKVLGIMYGGIGDCLIIANTCSCLTDFTFAVKDQQVPLISRINGCRAVPLSYARNVTNHHEYDAVVNFMYFLSLGSSLKTGDYYSLTEKVIRQKSPLSGLDIPHRPTKGIYVHMQASNPNRDWKRDYWREVLPQLAKIEPVYLLGQMGDFRVEGDNIYSLADESSDLVFQAEKLSTAKYFLGVDSGFAHVAGILGVKGNILFFNTKASDVIARYPSLSGIDAFGDREPSRSTKIPCPLSEEFKNLLTPGIVIQIVIDSYNSNNGGETPATPTTEAK